MLLWKSAWGLQLNALEVKCRNVQSSSHKPTAERMHLLFSGETSFSLCSLLPTAYDTHGGLVKLGLVLASCRTSWSPRPTRSITRPESYLDLSVALNTTSISEPVVPLLRTLTAWLWMISHWHALRCWHSLRPHRRSLFGHITQQGTMETIGRRNETKRTYKYWSCWQ